MTTGTITGHFTLGGVAVPGVPLLFTPSVPRLQNGGGDIVLVMAPTNVATGATGSFSVVLQATDDPAMTPINWTYRVTGSTPDGQHLDFSMSLPGGTTVDLADVTPAFASTGTVPPTTPSTFTVDVMRDFHAAGDGVTDDSVAIQNAIDYCVGGSVAAGASTSRVAIASLYFPPGTYRTTVAPKVVSVSGFEMFGAANYASTIKVSGVRTYGIELDGLRSCHIRDLRVIGTDGTGSTDTVRDAIALNWTTAAVRSTSQVIFERLLIHQLKYTNGLTLGLDSPARQVDDISVYSCTVNGQWSVGEATWWQTGFQSGNGTSGNVLNHNYWGCASSVNRYNVYANIVNVSWQGGDVGHGEIDFRHAGSLPFAINGVRSEVSQRLYSSNGGASFSSSASITNVLFGASGIAADNRFIQIQYGGTYFLENVVCDINAATPKILVASVAAFSIYVTVVGMQSRQALTSLFDTTATAPTIFTVLNYCQVNGSNQALNPAGDAVWVKGVNQKATATFEDLSGRIKPRVGTVASSATPTINTDTTDLFTVTALAAAITSFTTNLSGTPVDGQGLVISITDNGTARAITWGASFEASTVALPATTVISTRLDVEFVWNTATSKWRCVRVS